MSVDTLSLARELRAADIEPAHAEAIAAAIGRSVNETTLDAATVGDLAQMRSEMRADNAGLRAEIATLRTELKSDVAAVDRKIAGLDGRVGELFERVDGITGRIEAAMLKWFIATLIALAGVAIAILAKLSGAF